MLVHKTRTLMVLGANWISIITIIRLNIRSKGQNNHNIHLKVSKNIYF